MRQHRGARTGSTPAAEPGWVTLRAAHDATGVPIDTLRKWGRRGTVPSSVVETDAGRRRIVRLDSVVALARRQGRPLAGADAERAAAPATAPPAPGTMIVPIDAWDKMLMQLGNLHEAGQQLAEARERAAKAETEAAFLRERLAELRTDPARATESSEPLETAEAVVRTEPPDRPRRLLRAPADWWQRVTRGRRGTGER